MHVKRGQVLVRIDPADAQLASEQAEATYAQTIRRVEQYFANAAQAAAQVTARNSDVSRANQDYGRRVALAKAGAIANEQVTDYRNTYETARADLAAAQQTLAGQQALIRGTDVAHNPEVLAAKAALDTAKLSLSRTVIRAPFDGVVAQKNVQIGQRVQVGQALMSVVPVNTAYVDANSRKASSRMSGRASPYRSHPTSTDRTSCSMGGYRASPGAPVPRFALIPPRTQPATGSRWCSACPCAWRSIRTNSPNTRCASGCR